MNKYIQRGILGKVILVCLCISTNIFSPSHGLPLELEESQQHAQPGEQTDRHNIDTDLLEVRGFQSFDDISNFLRTWFRRLQSQVMSTDDDHVTQSRRKRDSPFSGVQLDISNNSTDEASFEKYEKEYLIQQTMAALKTLYYHKEYVDYLKSKTMNADHRKPSNNKDATAAPPPTDSNGTNVPDFNRVDPILEAKLNELRNLNNDALNRIFRDVRRAVEDGVADNSIASLCCQIAG